MKTQCPKCSTVYKLSVDSSTWSKAARCKKCGETFQVLPVSTHKPQVPQQPPGDDEIHDYEELLPIPEDADRRHEYPLIKAKDRRQRVSGSQRQSISPGPSRAVLARCRLMWICAIAVASFAIIAKFVLTRSADEQTYQTAEPIAADPSTADIPLESDFPVQHDADEPLGREPQTNATDKERAANSVVERSPFAPTSSSETAQSNDSDRNAVENSHPGTAPVTVQTPPNDGDEESLASVSEPQAEPEEDGGRRHAAPEPGGAIPARILQRLKAATVFVRVNVGSLVTSGSGFLLKTDGNTGYVVTNAHVVTLRGRLPGRVHCVFHSGTKGEQTVPAAVVGLDEARDLAVLKVKLDTLPEPVSLEGQVAVGETLPVFIVGFPFGDVLRTSERHPAVTISRASVSSIRRDDYDRVAVIQIDGDINPGNSGGPIVDARGRLIGITVAKVKGTQIGIAIPAEKLSQMLNGRVGRVRIQGRKAQDGVANVNAEVRLIDPMRKIKAVSMRYVRRGQVQRELKPDRDGLWPRLPDARKVDLKLEGQRANAEFKIRRQSTQRVEYIFQVAYTRGSGKTVYTEPGRFTVNPVRPGLAGGVAGQRAHRTARPPRRANSGDGAPRQPAVRFSWREPEVNVVTPPAETAVAGRIQRDSTGSRFTALTANGTRLDLGQELLQIVACPTGKVVYVIRRGEPVVDVVDPLTWKTVTEIPVPASPTSIWADTALIGVACDKSRVVALIDAQKRSLIASGTLPELRGYTPDTVVGRAPDGSVMSFWQSDGSPRWERVLVHTTLDGKSRIMINREPIYWANWLPDGTGVIGHTSFNGSPSGVVDLVFPQGPRQFRELHNNRLLGIPGFHSDTGPAFLTSNRKALVLPRTRLKPGDWQRSTSGYSPDDSVPERRTKGTRLPWTYLLSPSFDKILGEFPGNAFVELAQQRLFISIGIARGTQPVCYYVSSTDGRVVREITLEWPKAAQQSRQKHPSWRPFTPHSRPVFVPGHELLLIPNQDRRLSDRQLTYTAFRCGPVANNMLQAPTNSAAVNDPPSSVAVGDELNYTPVLQPAVKASAFRLKRALPGMTIEPRTGKLAWRPAREHVGRWPITILATVDGEEVTVITWTLEVR